jgi:hypothetical protein
MARYKISATVEDTNINIVKAKLLEVFKNLPEAGIHAEKIETKVSRADRLGEAEKDWDNAKSIVQELHDEMEEWHDNMPENLKDGDKGQEVEAAKDALQEILDSLEQADFSGVSFPGMY